jgi:hypothetical protein
MIGLPLDLLGEINSYYGGSKFEFSLVVGARPAEILFSSGRLEPRKTHVVEPDELERLALFSVYPHILQVFGNSVNEIHITRGSRGYDMIVVDDKKANLGRLSSILRPGAALIVMDGDIANIEHSRRARY